MAHAIALASNSFTTTLDGTKIELRVTIFYSFASHESASLFIPILLNQMTIAEIIGCTRSIPTPRSGKLVQCEGKNVFRKANAIICLPQISDCSPPCDGFFTASLPALSQAMLATMV